MRFYCTSLALLAAIAIPTVARADNFLITTGTDTLTFSLPSSPTPSTYTADGISTFDNISVVYDGVATTDTIGFYTTDGGGGFYDNFFGAPFGDQYFTGDTSAPTFTPGSFFFTNGDSPIGVITISGDTPEPSALFLFGTGALGLAGVARRRITRA